MAKRTVLLSDFLSPLARGGDEPAFSSARTSVLSEGVSWSGIGALSEKCLHKILKLYIEPNTSFHEVEYRGFINDIKNASGIFEVQTRNYEKLLPKIKKLADSEKITVVCPLATEKKIAWLDKDSGEMTKPRVSAKKENIFDAIRMLFGIRDMLSHENVCVRVVYLKVEDFRYLNGVGKDKKRFSTRIERIPDKILCEINLSTAEDYASFLPLVLPDEFTMAEFARAIKRTTRYSFYVMRTLVSVGAVIEAGKRGRAAIYKRAY